jgi:putative membrane protein
LKTVFAIFFRDLKRLIHNPAAVIVALGVCVLPSLYAWFNIIANWDPYKNTSDIAIAIVNEDAGADISGMGHIDAGDMVVDELRENT